MSSQAEAEQALHDTINKKIKDYLSNSRITELCFGTVVSYNATNHSAVVTYSTDSTTQVTLMNLSHFTLVANDQIVILRYGITLEKAYIIGDLTQL